MSPGASAGFAPCWRRLLQPRDVGLVRGPGTARTARPWSSAQSAVIRAPDPGAASTTTVTPASPEIRRFRLGEAPARGGSPGGRAASREPPPAHALVQCAIRGRVDDAEPVSEDADGGPARLERGGVRDRVDAARHTAHDHHSGARPAGGEMARRFAAIRRVVAATDDSSRGPGQPCYVAPDEEHR